jgi:hypothetical protein
MPHITTNKKEYMAWYHARNRCHDSSHIQYKDYGGRGIQMSEEFRSSFDTFFDHVGKSKPQQSLDRIDNSNGYERGNIRWTDRTTQNNNTRTNVYIEYKGETLTVSQCLKFTTVDEFTVRARLGLGWTIYQALGEEPAPSRASVTKALRTWCKEQNVAYANAAKRLYVLKWSVGQALGFELPPNTISVKSPVAEEKLRQFECDGKIQSLKKWSEETGLKKSIIAKRFDKLRWTARQALGIDPHI